MTTIKAGPAALGRYSVTGFQGGNEPRVSFGTLTLLPTGRYEFVWDAAAEKMPRDSALEFARELAFIREPQGTYTLSYAGGLSGETILNELKDRKTELAHIEFASKRPETDSAFAVRYTGKASLPALDHQSGGVGACPKAVGEFGRGTVVLS